MEKVDSRLFKANVKLVDSNKELRCEINRLKEIIQKAVTYIEDKSVEYKPHYRRVDLNTKDCCELLDILDGEVYE